MDSMEYERADREKLERAEKMAAQLRERERPDGGWADQLQRQLALLSSLEELADQLQVKLDPVLMEPVDMPTTPQALRPAPTTQLAMHMQNVGDRLEGLAQRLHQLQTRVEL